MNSKKYISVEDAIKTTWMILKGLGYAIGENPQLKETVHAIFDTAPTIDAVPVETRQVGQWIDDNCSVCGQYVYRGDARNYCPNCGAKMDEEGEDDE